MDIALFLCIFTFVCVCFYFHRVIFYWIPLTTDLFRPLKTSKSPCISESASQFDYYHAIYWMHITHYINQKWRMHLTSSDQFLYELLRCAITITIVQWSRAIYLLLHAFLFATNISNYISLSLCFDIGSTFDSHLTPNKWTSYALNQYGWLSYFSLFFPIPCDSITRVSNKTQINFDSVSILVPLNIWNRWKNTCADLWGNECTFYMPIVHFIYAFLICFLIFICTSKCDRWKWFKFMCVYCSIIFMSASGLKAF